jgi:pimeloyl-ACP methyl ester carboxylesterase
MPRLLFIHGYVEDATIFDQLIPLLPPNPVVRLNLVDEFARWQPAGRFSARDLARYLAGQYAITSADVVIGHSMGGWVGINIKELTGARVVQLATWTDQRKIRFPTQNLRVLKFLLDTGLTQSRTLTRFFKKQYRFAESAELYGRLVDGTAGLSRPYIFQQQQTLFAPVTRLTVQPDLRIHARHDNIVAPPDEPYVEVPGDHFSLVFHPERVAEPIRKLISD